MTTDARRRPCAASTPLQSLRGLPVAVAIALAAAATPAAAAVFGPDDRVSVPARLEAVAERIGLLFNNRARTVCSAFCVADNLIATAAHCLARTEGRASAHYADFMFARGYDRKRDFVRIEGSAGGSGAQHVVAGDFKLRIKPPIDAVNDWALLRLGRASCPSGIPVEELSTADLAAASSAGKVFQISYHRDWAQWRAAYSKPCTVARDFPAAQWTAIAPDFLDADRMILHTCDTGGASSGSPLLVERPGGVVVAGINVGTYVQTRVSTRGGQAAGKPRQEMVANTAVASEVFRRYIQPLQTGTILAAGAPIRTLQERLQGHGHYDGKLDGAYGPLVKAAIEAYESANKLPVTGLATEALLARLGREPVQRGELAPSNATGR